MFAKELALNLEVQSPISIYIITLRGARDNFNNKEKRQRTALPQPHRNMLPMITLFI